MKVEKAKTVRFAALVEKCGHPEPVTLWTDPEKDKQFMAAVRQNRVLSIKQTNLGSHTDFGLVGFIKEKSVSYFIFPKSLKSFENRRVVGIKYDLIETPGPVGKKINSEKLASKKRTKTGKEPVVSELELPRSKRLHDDARLAAKKAQKSPKRFRVVFRFRAEADVEMDVPAENRKSAIAVAEKEIETPDFSKATITRKVLKATLT